MRYRFPVVFSVVLSAVTTAAAALTLAPAAHAQNTVRYNFGTVGGQFGDLTTSPSSGSFFAQSISAISIGNSFGTVSANNRLSTTSPSSGYTGATGGGNLANAVGNGSTLIISSSAYYEFTITPDYFYRGRITGIRFGARSASGTGPTRWSIRTGSNFSTELDAGTFSASGNWELIQAITGTYTGPTNFDNNEGVLRFRIYTWGATNNFSGNVNIRIDDVAVTGNAISGGSIAPEPGALALALSAGVPALGFVRRRRKSAARA